MAKFYFTYGSGSAFPYQDGWTEVFAENRSFAIMAFERFHPKRPGSPFINCAIIYSERDWEKTQMAARGTNFGHGCHERITVDVQNNLTSSFECEDSIVYTREECDE